MLKCRYIDSKFCEQCLKSNKDCTSVINKEKERLNNVRIIKNYAKK